MPGIDAYEKQFATTAAKLRGPAWLGDLRLRGLEDFKALGFPSLRNEDWRFTRTRAIAEREFDFVAAYRSNGLSSASIAELTFDDSGCHRVVIVDGHFAADLSRVGKLPGGARVSSLREALTGEPELIEPYLGSYAPTDGHVFAALNTAFVNDGVFVFLPDGVTLDDPVHAVFVSTAEGRVSHPRLLVVAGSGASATIVESHAGPGVEYFRNTVAEFVIGANASVHHTKIQRDVASAFHVAAQHATLARDSRFSTENITMGGVLTRNDIHTTLDGEGIDCRMDGLYLAAHGQHVDNHTHIRHARPRCHSFELYKGILAGKSRGVFNGKIYVDQDAQKTDAKQENNCILLSDDARINTNPQLEIFADDVKCTHGATVGQLDADAIFYLRSRGIPADEALHLLVHAFAGEVIERVPVTAAREHLESELFGWLSRSAA